MVNTRISTTLICLGGAVLAVVASISWWLSVGDERSTLPVRAAIGPTMKTEQPAPPLLLDRKPIPEPFVVERTVPSELPRAGRSIEISIADLTQQFRVAPTIEARVDLAQEIAGRNTAEAVRAIQQVFVTERHPRVKAALLSGLGDMDATLAPEVRLQVITSALRGEGREVRSTALDLLSEDESPTATALLRLAMKTDPDQELREAAAAYCRRRENGR